MIRVLVIFFLLYAADLLEGFSDNDTETNYTDQNEYYR